MANLFNNFIVFSRQYKNEERLGHSFFSYIKIKWSTGVSQSLKAALDYVHFINQYISDVWKNIFSIEKLNLVGWEKWNFGGGNKNLVGGIYWEDFSRWEG